ncbi:MAG: DUF89 family protein [Lachnospiraceae bacterium]|nr:DUF89 family protein [Lachnospiraceae bacterium]
MTTAGKNKIKTDLNRADCLSFYRTMASSHARLPDVCEACLMKKGYGHYPSDASDEEIEAYREEFLKIIARHADDMCAPEITMLLDEMRERRFGTGRKGLTDYAPVKRHFNEFMLRFVPQVEEDIRSAPDPFLRAMQYALTGNVIDFASPERVDEDSVSAALARAREILLDSGIVRDLKERVRTASSIVYLTDNCGEVVMDRLFLREIKALAPSSPAPRITVIVKGAPAVNDATIEDALQAGLDKEAEVIGNGRGNAVGGTSIPLMDDKSRGVLLSAGLIISKGMGNFETLIESGLDIFHLFLCKCDLFVNFFQAERMQGLLVHQH